MNITYKFEPFRPLLRFSLCHLILLCCISCSKFTMEELSTFVHVKGFDLVSALLLNKRFEPSKTFPTSDFT